jgi:hypothetical protein
LFAFRRPRRDASGKTHAVVDTRGGERGSTPKTRAAVLVESASILARWPS